MSDREALPEPDLEPVPATRAPVLEVVVSAEAMYVFEPGRPDGYLMAERPIEVRR